MSRLAPSSQEHQWEQIDRSAVSAEELTATFNSYFAAAVRDPVLSMRPPQHPELRSAGRPAGETGGE